MAATETTKNKTPKFRARKSCFPACFGLSSDASKPEGEDLDGKSSPEKNGRKKPQWKTTTENAGSGGEKNNFRWPKLRKKKSGRKTVPVDAPVAEKTTLGQNSNEEIREETEELTEIQDPVGKSQILGSLVLKRVQSPVVALPCSVVGVAEPDQGGKPRKGMFTNYRSQQKLQNEGQKPPESSIPGTELSQKPAISNRRTLSYGGREIDNRKPGSQPASPENKTKLSMISSSSFPPPGGRKNAHTPRLSRLGNRNPNRETGNIAGEFDPVVGLSVLMITLAIMLLWGRICAIICTSAWFYFVPRLKTVINSGEVAENEKHSGELDINSSEYKKKVIMEGLLERSHRNAAGIS